MIKICSKMHNFRFFLLYFFKKAVENDVILKKVLKLQYSKTEFHSDTFDKFDINTMKNEKIRVSLSFANENAC